jgi:EpsI family protein
MSSRTILIGAVGILSIQALLTYGLARVEHLPSPPPLALFPRAFGEWTSARDVPVDPVQLAMLAPDDVLNRDYLRGGESPDISLFIAYYRSQHSLGGAHDPKVCLPGSGWTPQASEVWRIEAEGSAAPIPVNYYLISRNRQQAVVLYWFQTHRGVTPSEQWLRLKRVWQTLADHRTDMALIRIVAPVEGELREASDRAVRFAALVFPALRRQFPPAPGENVTPE